MGVAEGELGRVTLTAQQLRSGARDDRLYQEAQSVEKMVAGEGPYECAAAIDEDVLAVLLLEGLMASVTSPSITTELFHFGDSSVVDATYLRVLFIQSAFGTSLPRSGHDAANVS